MLREAYGAWFVLCVVRDMQICVEMKTRVFLDVVDVSPIALLPYCVPPHHYTAGQCLEGFSGFGGTLDLTLVPSHFHQVFV